jgi:hypothetical protein
MTLSPVALICLLFFGGGIAATMPTDPDRPQLSAVERRVWLGVLGCFRPYRGAVALMLTAILIGTLLGLLPPLLVAGLHAGLPGHRALAAQRRRSHVRVHALHPLGTAAAAGRAWAFAVSYSCGEPSALRLVERTRAMHVHAKLGCLLHSRVISGSYHAVNSRVTVEQTYGTTMVKFDRPVSGAAQAEVVCPSCGQPVTFSVSSASRVQLFVLTWLLLLVGVVALLGWTLFAMKAPTAVMPRIGLGILAVSGLALAALVTVVLTKPDLLDYQSGALSISADPAARGGSESKGHKLLSVWVKEGVRGGKQAPSADERGHLPPPHDSAHIARPTGP